MRIGGCHEGNDCRAILESTAIEGLTNRPIMKCPVTLNLGILNEVVDIAVWVYRLWRTGKRARLERG